MNAVISLCHFCELHGPNIIMSTQAFHETTQPPAGLRNVSKDEHKQFYGDPESLGDSEKLREEEETGTCRACHSLDNSEVIGKDYDNKWVILNPLEGVNSSKNKGVCYLSNDHKRRVSYVTRRTPCHPRLRRLLRQACVLSLSCEVSEGREGPVSFSLPGEGGTCGICRKTGASSGNGQALSHTFLLKDSRARGFHRWFSIVVVMKDHIYLLNSWPFLVESLSRLISSLQSWADKVYEKEQADHPQRALRLIAAAKAPTVSAAPTRVQSPKKAAENETKDDNKLEEATGGPPSFDPIQQTSSSSASPPQSTVSTPSTLGPARSLTELTNDPMIFIRLHNWFVWILKAGANRLSEKMVDSLPTKCVSFDFDQHQETEEGFTLISSREDAFSSIIESLEGNIECGVRDGTVKGKEASERCSKLFSSLSLSTSTLRDSNEEANQIVNSQTESHCNHWVEDDGDDEDFACWMPSNLSENGADLPESAPLALCHLRSALGGSLFQSLLYAFLTGSQVVLRGSPINLLLCIAKALKFLVPKKCYHPVYNAEEYLPPSKANILVLGPHVAVPSLSASCGIYPDLNDMIPSSSASTSHQNTQNSAPSVFRIDLLPPGADQEVGDSAAGYWGSHRLVAKRGNISTSVKYPTLVVKIDKAIDNATLGSSALQCHLISLREEWINISEVISRVKRSRRFFGRGPLLGVEFGSSVEEESILLQSLGGQDQDWPLIWFWIYGLRKNG